MPDWSVTAWLLGAVYLTILGLIWWQAMAISLLAVAFAVLIWREHHGQD